MIQPTLWDTGEYVADRIIAGNRKPIYRHLGHSQSGMRKPFIAWDGEGYTDEFGFHHYWLLANSVGDKIIAPPGRSIERYNIARVFHRVQSTYPNAIQCGFALGYDFTMLLRSNGLDSEHYETLRRKGHINVDGYMWRLMMGKQLTVWPEAGGNQEGRFNLQDTWGFFQRSFVKALDEYFGKDWKYRDTIIEMKQQRSGFDREHDEQVMQYNDMELELLVMLMEELRDRLFASGMPVSRWYGPGAIANGLLQKWRIKDAQEDLYKVRPNIAAASQFAYAGGRFELIKAGHANGPVYQYDINSAYPYALSRVPNLVDGEWRHVNKPSIDELTEFSVVRIRWTTDAGNPNFKGSTQSLSDIYPRSIPFPLFKRNPRGGISFPSHGIHGWYWAPEIHAAIKYSRNLPDYFNARWELEEAYIYTPHTNDRPFGTIPILYNTRQRLKAAGNGAHIGIKLGLNSLYGKFAQQVGWSPERPKIPPFHNLATAGYITSVCRAMMVEAMSHDPASVIAFETDGIFSLSPLPLDVGNQLGQWELTEYDDMWYFQSGFRFGILNGDIIKPATRGIPSKDIDLESIKRQISNALGSVKLTQTQFITLQWANSMKHQDWAGQWKDTPKELRLMGENVKGKRIHDPDCYMCDVDETGNRWYRWDQMHVTLPASGWENEMNYPHDVLWSDLMGVKDNEEDLGLDAVIEP